MNKMIGLDFTRLDFAGLDLVGCLNIVDEEKILYCAVRRIVTHTAFFRHGVAP